MTVAGQTISDELTRPIVGIENRTPQEAFDIMCDRIRHALAGQHRREAEAGTPVAWIEKDALAKFAKDPHALTATVYRHQLDDTWAPLFAASPPSPASGVRVKAEDRRVVWLIERKGFAGDPRPHWYWEDARGRHAWTPEASAALPFESEADAKAFPSYRMISRDPDISITEHVFLSALVEQP